MRVQLPWWGWLLAVVALVAVGWLLAGGAGASGATMLALAVGADRAARAKVRAEGRVQQVRRAISSERGRARQDQQALARAGRRAASNKGRAPMAVPRSRWRQPR